MLPVDSKPLFFTFFTCLLAENQWLKLFKSLDSRSKACGKDGGKNEFKNLFQELYFNPKPCPWEKIFTDSDPHINTIAVGTMEV